MECSSKWQRVPILLFPHLSAGPHNVGAAASGPPAHNLATCALLCVRAPTCNGFVVDSTGDSTCTLKTEVATRSDSASKTTVLVDDGCRTLLEQILGDVGNLQSTDLEVKLTDTQTGKYFQVDPLKWAEVFDQQYGRTFTGVKQMRGASEHYSGDMVTFFFLNNGAFMGRRATGAVGSQFVVGDRLRPGKMVGYSVEACKRLCAETPTCVSLELKPAEGEAQGRGICTLRYGVTFNKNFSSSLSFDVIAPVSLSQCVKRWCEGM